MSYSPTLGRFLERDPIEYADGMNSYRFVDGNPVKFVDPSGLYPTVSVGVAPPGGWGGPQPPPYPVDPTRDRLGSVGSFDPEGWVLLNWWLSGKGGDLTFDQPSWGDYMKANTLLPPQLRGPILSDAYGRLKSGTFSRTLHTQIESGYSTGYEMLSGSNANVGDFHMEGPATVTCSPDGSRTVRYSITYTWNDIMDPNPIYAWDRWFSNVLHTFFNAVDYTVHIKWKSDVEVKIHPDGNYEATGYPFEK